MKKKIYIITGGTINVIRPHFAVSAPAYGTVGKKIYNEFKDPRNYSDSSDAQKYEVILLPTMMALSVLNDVSDIMRYWEIMRKIGLKKLETNTDLSRLVDNLVDDPDTRCIIMAAAVCDFEPSQFFENDPDTDKFGMEYPRLKSVNYLNLELKPSAKIISKIRKTRKDIFMVNFKTTSNAGFDETYKQGLLSLKKNSSNLVFANDIAQKINMIVTPEEFPYAGDDRNDTIRLLAKMTYMRINLTFEDKTYVVNDDRAFPEILMTLGRIPQNWYDVMKYLFANNAFKPLPSTGKTSGHFGCRVTGNKYERITSERKIDHNTSFERGMIPVYSYSDKQLVVGGAKPSVGEKTQEMIYQKYGEAIDAIVHFHCPLKSKWTDRNVPTRDQMPFECGSKECALNTTDGMTMMEPGIYAVHLDNHGPNIAFSSSVKTEDLIRFINEHWDLSDKTGGIVK